MEGIIYQQYDFAACEEIYQRAIDYVSDFYRQNGCRPKLILGWGTYLSICIIESRFGDTNPQYQARLIKPRVFNNCEIVIDPGYEFRIQATGRNNQDLFQVAVDALFKSKQVPD